jgi:hypothetical protein
MIRFLRLVVLAAIAIALLLFAYANRQIVIVSFDPVVPPDNAALAIRSPLFAVVFACAMLGVVLGSWRTWVSQGRHRRAARRHRAEADRWRREAEALKAERQPPALPRS